MRHASVDVLCDVTRSANVDLAAGAWPEALEMPEKPSGVYKMQETLGGRAFAQDPAEGAYSASTDP